MIIEYLKKFLSNSEQLAAPPYDYKFIINLQEREYPKYLKKFFFYATGKDLNLNNPKTFNEKIQWLKLYDNSRLKTQLTDKVLVRGWIKEKIGEEYLKPVLWIGKNFDEIPFDKLPNTFIIKANHGCRWNYRIKNKELFLKNEVLYQIVRKRMNEYMEISFFPFAGFELQYKDINPQIIIEELLLENVNETPREIEIYCFNGKPQIFQKIKYGDNAEVSIFNKDYENINLKFLNTYVLKEERADELLKQAVNLSEKLAGDFKLVRVDWLIYKDRLYFNEMTFTPFSGHYLFEDNSWNYKLGKMLNIKK